MQLLPSLTMSFLIGTLGLGQRGAEPRAAADTAVAERPIFNAEDEKWKGKYQDAGECKLCHTKPVPEHLAQESDKFVLLTEYSIWKTHDKHAQAYAALLGPRGRRMAEILGNVIDPRTGCMNCHAMSNLFERSTEDIVKHPPDGVSCGGCHGPSQNWYEPHRAPKRWRHLNPAEKAEMGFCDLRDPETRAELCMSCHIGKAKAGKVVTHVMFAAGHPPLPPIEIATFSRNQPQHWRDSKDVPLFRNPRAEIKKENYHLETTIFQQTRLAVVGAVVALRETLRLVQDRAQLDVSNPQQVWPELLKGLEQEAVKNPGTLHELAATRWPQIAMTHLDCYACHHELKYPGFRQQRGSGYLFAKRSIRTAPGRPVVRLWSLPVLEASLANPDDRKKLEDLTSNLQAIAHACDTKPFADRKDLSRAAADAITWCDGVIRDLRHAPYGEEYARKLLLNLVQLYGPAWKSGPEDEALLPDYESARQIASVIQTVWEEWRSSASVDKKTQSEFDRIMEQLSTQLNLQPYTKRRERLGVILEVVKRSSSDPNVSGMEEFSKYLQKIRNEALLHGLEKNRFLQTMKEEVTNESFTKQLLAEKVIEKLQDFSDSELAGVLTSMAEYDPKSFQASLRALAELLSRRNR